jgi:hypothetical protein
MIVVAARRPSASRQFNVVKISLSLNGDPSSSPPTTDNRVLFDISIDGKQAGLLDATVEEVGLPLTLGQARIKQTSDSDYGLPDHIGAALEHVVLGGGEPLWLSFPQPSGYLPIIPWELLLNRRLDVPILRLCYTSVQPIVSTQSLDIIVCFSFPVSKQVMNPKEVIYYFFDHIPDNIQRYTTFHVFADAAVQPVLVDVRNRKPQCQINIYDPRQASQYEVPSANTSPSDSVSEVESPWLLWIRDAMGSRSADVVHFFCHGYLGREDGFLCFAQSPLQNDDERFARFVGARQICSFLDQVGAWSVAFSSQPGNYSIAGLRLLHDQMAHIRPGPVLYHDMQLDPESLGLCETYQYAYAIEEAFPPKSSAISLICHPDWAMPVSDPDDESKNLVDTLTLAGRMPDVFEGVENTPSWIASGQRSLERSVAQLISTTPANPAEVLQSGTADALRFVSDVLARHAKSFGLGVKEKL